MNSRKDPPDSLAQETFEKMGQPTVFVAIHYLWAFGEVAQAHGIDKFTEPGRHEYFAVTTRPEVEKLIALAARPELIRMAREVYNQMCHLRQFHLKWFYAAFAHIAHKHDLAQKKNRKLYNATFTEVINQVITYFKDRHGKPFEDVRRGLDKPPTPPDVRGNRRKKIPQIPSGPMATKRQTELPFTE